MTEHRSEQAAAPLRAHEGWLAQFDRDGEVTVRQPRATVGSGLIAGSAVFLAGGLFLLLSPGFGPGPRPLLVVGGAVSVALGLAALAAGVRTLVRPALVVHLGPAGLRPAVGPVVPWSEVLGACVMEVGTTRLPAVQVDPAYFDRDPGLVGWRRKGWELHRRWYGANVALRHAPPDGNEEVVRLILSVRHRVTGRP